MSRSLVYALTSLPFLVVFFLEKPFGITYLSLPGTGDAFRFIADLVFMNYVHICFSFFLYRKLPEFRQTLEGMPIKGIAIGIAAFVGALLALGWNGRLIPLFALGHAFLQSVGIFLLYYALPERRAWVKKAAWFWLAVLALLSQDLWTVSEEARYAMGIAAFGTLAAGTRSPLGLLFAGRFFLWFSPTPLGSFYVGALHGLEYLLIVTQLLADRRVRWQISDIPFAGVLVAFVIAQTFRIHEGRSFLPLDFAFLFMLFIHYAFDSYVYRFQLARPRQFILPLFIRGRDS